MRKRQEQNLSFLLLLFFSIKNYTYNIHKKAILYIYFISIIYV